jgi:hypothetical protein
MADLDFPMAQRIAAALTTIGHPYNQEAIDATAWDLVEWCKGVIIDGKVYSPEDQARALVNTARLEWDCWPEGGTANLRALFLLRFAPKPKVEQEGPEKWKAEGASYDPHWSRRTLGSFAPGADEIEALKYEGMMSTLWYREGPGRNIIDGSGKSQQFWQDADQHYREKHAAEYIEVRRKIAEIADFWQPYDLKKDTHSGKVDRIRPRMQVVKRGAS